MRLLKMGMRAAPATAHYDFPVEGFDQSRKTLPESKGINGDGVVSPEGVSQPLTNYSSNIAD